ncbi:cytochrome c [Consotaella salsifontis]|uniref:Cytochrome c n=1 Tax=Consotaella salsifontis TaxID=1365950 RepID=A0A1T4NI21_9HYPH|nr:cytochrome c [Consotaella salsifontis]SJZ78716.1 Cytochrome c [Consotaella salsifontis]
MRTFLKILAALVVVGVIALLAFIFVPVQTTGPKTALAADYQVPDGAGAYAMRLADCAACHTAEGGKPFAGGRPIESPFGIIYSSNITPDNETGIGSYTLDEFRAALYDGIRKDGAHLYPAMPYANYRKLSEEDVRALYHYFHDELKPVNNQVTETKLDFPFNQRWGIRAWNWVALPDAQFVPPFQDDQLNRGAYLVQGPGHCGACHSPRNDLFAQAGYTAADDAFLTGGEIAGWSAPNLRSGASAPQSWDAEQLALFLATGRNAHQAVTGEMTLVVEDSLQYFTDDDMAAVVAYLRRIGTNGPAPESSAPASSGDKSPAGTPTPATSENDTSKLLASADPGMALGPRLYLDNCNACHFNDGKGASEVFPPLDGNSLVNSQNATGLISVILNGAELPSTAKRPYRLRMPGFADRLSDDEVAALATFVRQGWSNNAGAVTADSVSALRKQGGEQAAEQSGGR